jgi:hypothetical protein
MQKAPWLASLVERFSGRSLAADTTSSVATPSTRRGIHYFAICLFGIAILLRLYHYLGNRSLWSDEARLVLNLLDRSFIELLGPLDGNQVAPIGFLMIEKFATEVFGTSEYVLRLFPFMAAIASVFLLFVLARKVGGRLVGIYALAAFAVAPSAIYYAAEVKQYSSDVASALILYLCAVRLLEKWDRTRLTVLAIAGVITVCVSHPSAFIAAGIGSTLGAYFLFTREWRRFFQILIVCAVWLIAFVPGIYYASSEISEVVNLMREVWTGAFMPFPPTSLSDLEWYTDAFFSMVDFTTGLNRASLGVALFLFLAGGYSLWKCDKMWLFLLVLPILITLFVSSFHLYPFDGRLLLFLSPGMLIVIAVGLEELRRALWDNHRAAWLMLAGLLVLNPALAAAQAFALSSPYARQEMRPVLEAIVASKEKWDRVYVYPTAQPMFRYYADRLGLDESKVISGIYLDDAGHYLKNIRKLLKGQGRVWVVFAREWDMPESTERWFFLSFFDLFGTRHRSVEATGASAYLYDFGSPEHSSRTLTANPLSSVR